MSSTKRINKVIIKRLADETGEADWLGKYSNEPGPEANTIDRRARGHWKPGQYCFFIAENVENYEQALENYTRMEAGMNGEWHLIGIRAEAEVVLTGSTCQKLISGGLWGVESDAGEEYLAGIEGEQLEELRSELEAVGFTEAEIKEAFANVKRADVI